MNSLEITFDEAGFSRSVRWSFENGYRVVAKNPAINTPKKLKSIFVSDAVVEIHSTNDVFCLTKF